jgi:hypothetical protein
MIGGSGCGYIMITSHASEPRSRAPPASPASDPRSRGTVTSTVAAVEDDRQIWA